MVERSREERITIGHVDTIAIAPLLDRLSEEGIDIMETEGLLPVEGILQRPTGIV